ncbi:MAG: lytic murein transglycosylase B [Burkholderiales bacterium]|nr:lytic murein transglycosylase B [Burkholderiales bacterium]
MKRALGLLLCALLALALGAASLSFAAGTTKRYTARKDVHEFISQMVDRHGFVKEELRQVFKRARFKPEIITAITPPSTPRAKSWSAYRALFLTPERIEAGVEFREQQREALAHAAELYGVPEEIIVGIIGVETVYGRNTGSYRIIDALTTLAFDYPPRAEFFRGELENYLIYARSADIDILAMKGSYAGAIGIPQFMPSSYLRYAVDLDGDGKQDLSNSFPDAIGSVANYLKEHGWKTGQPVAFPAQVRGQRYRELVEAGIKPATRYGDLAGLGVSANGNTGAEALCALIELATPDEASEYLVAFNNFYVLTRYNRSSMYATAVLELAQAVKAAAQAK